MSNSDRPDRPDRLHRAARPDPQALVWQLIRETTQQALREAQVARLSRRVARSREALVEALETRDEEVVDDLMTLLQVKKEQIYPTVDTLRQDAAVLDVVRIKLGAEFARDVVAFLHDLLTERDALRAQLADNSPRPAWKKP